jgi:hypothetical protein
LCALLAFISTGCSTPTGYFVKEWSRPIREMQLKPIFPPREDVVPGDLVADPYPNAADEEAAISTTGHLEFGPTLYSVPLLKQLQAHYDNRPLLPATPTKGIDGEFPEATTTQGSVFSGGPRNRMAHVAFPEVSFTDLTQGNLEALVPLQAINVALGGAFGEFRNVSLKLRGAESYGLPAATVVGALRDEMANPHRASRLAAVWRLGSAAILITEVFTTRDLEITATFRGSFGARAGTQGFEGSLGGPLASEPDPQKRLEVLRAVNANLSSLQIPGGSIQATSVSDRAVTLKRVFVRPIVIGVRYARLVRVGGDPLEFAFDSRAFPSVAAEQAAGSRAPAAVQKPD